MATKSPKIHPQAIIHPGAKIHPSVEIGPFCIVGENVEIGQNCRLEAGVQLLKNVALGANCHLHGGVIIGGPPQDKKYKGEPSSIRIGENNILREYVTINLASGEGTATTLGDGNLLMAYVHVAHNCHIGNNNTLANVATLAGHVTIDDFVTIGGLVGIHQFVRVGSYSIIGGKSKVIQDIPPYMKADGNPCRLVGLNSVGLNRANFSTMAKDSLKKAYSIMYRCKLGTSEALKRIEGECDLNTEVRKFVAFFENSHRGVSKKTREFDKN